MNAKNIIKEYGLIIILVIAITFLHYSHESHIHELHGVYKLFFFLPIILGGFRGGKIGGLMVSGAVAASFYPHAFIDECRSCGSTGDKAIEMALYIGVGFLTGTLSDHLKNARNQLQHTLDEKSAMEAELLRSTRMAAVGRLSAGLAHEIRNPLASIQGSAEVLADDFAIDHPKSRMMTILQDETKRLNSVLTRFLEFARTEPGDRRPFELNKEIQSVAELIKHNPQYSDISCVVSGGDRPCMVMANREQIRQVLLNLALNAASAASVINDEISDSVASSSLQKSIRFHLTSEGKTCTCEVSDSGPGFSAEAHENFGTPFFSTKNGGTGLGLATSLKIVQDQGGTLAPGHPALTSGLVIMILPAPNTD